MAVVMEVFLEGIDQVPIDIIEKVPEDSHQAQYVRVVVEIKSIIMFEEEVEEESRNEEKKILCLM